MSPTLSQFTCGTWHTVRATYDGSTRRIYFDGVEVASDQPSAANVIGTTLHVGTSYYHFAALNGELGQVEIDDVAASSTEPQA